MKTCVFILAVCAVGAFGALSDEQKGRLRAHREACITESGAERAVVDNAYKGTWAEDDAKLRCFSSCFLTRLGMMNADGTFNEAETRKKIASDIPADKVDEVVGKCKDMKGVDKCETGLKLMKCYNENRAGLA